MNRTDIHHLAAAYALDALDETERASFEAHYAECDVCRVDVSEFRATLAVLASAQAMPPSPQLKERVLADVARTRQLSPRVPGVVVSRSGRQDLRRQRMTSAVLAVAAALILGTVGVVGGVIGHRVGTGSGYADAAADVLAQPDTVLVDLDGSAPGRFKVAWSQSARRAVVLGDDLASPGTGRVYELWLIDAGGPHPMRLLDPAGGGKVRRVLDAAGSPDAWGVTVESAAGSDIPTSEVLYVATV